MGHSHVGTDNLARGKHDARVLARKVDDYSRRRGRNLNSKQQSALDRYKKEEIFDFENERCSDEVVVNAYFRLFDDLFFGSKLQGRCKLKCSKRDSLQEGKHALTEFWDGSGHCIITIFKDNDREPCDRLFEYVAVLLHEMAHAFLELYTCYRLSCRNDINWLGVSGHGFAWQDMAFSLTKAVRDRQLLNLPLNLARYQNFAKELHKSNVSMPRDLARWGFKREDFVYMDGHYKVQGDDPY